MSSVSDLVGGDPLVGALARALPKQRWFGGKSRRVAGVHLVETELLSDPWPAMLWGVLEVAGGGRRATEHYQVVVGLRPQGESAPFLEGRPEAALGELPTEAGPAFGYDALADPELALTFLDRVAPDVDRPRRARMMTGEQSNTSVVYDERLFLKLFRRLHQGPNPEIEVPAALSGAGFTSVAAPLAWWTREDYDLAVVQPFLSGAVEGWSLALTSLRDLFALHDTQRVPRIDPNAPPPPATDPGQAGGDFSGEAGRLGRITADLHLALAASFGVQPGDPGRWAEAMDALLVRVRHPRLDRRRVGSRIAGLREVTSCGAAIRVHGDYHLGQVVRTDGGWHVLDFEGEPARDLAERRQYTSPLRDVAGMLRSLQYATAVVHAERGEDPTHPDEADAWEARNRQAFLEGYFGRASDAGLLPGDPVSMSVVLEAFELEKALYEVAYELANRPAWVEIPLAAIDRLLGKDASPS